MAPGNKRATITRDSVFRSTGAPSVRQGIQPTASPIRQTGMWLADDEVDWIDACCRRVRQGGWRGINRSAFIRALVQAAQTKQLDLDSISGEADLAEALKRSL